MPDIDAAETWSEWDGNDLLVGLTGLSPRGSQRQMTPTDEMVSTAQFGNVLFRHRTSAMRLTPLGFGQSARIHVLAPTRQEDWRMWLSFADLPPLRYRLLASALNLDASSDADTV